MRTKIHTATCYHCRKGGVVEVDATPEQLREFYSPIRRNIQFIFPELSYELREQIISGTHPECWDAMFAGLDKED